MAMLRKPVEKEIQYPYMSIFILYYAPKLGCSKCNVYNTYIIIRYLTRIPTSVVFMRTQN